MNLRRRRSKRDPSERVEHHEEPDVRMWSGGPNLECCDGRQLCIRVFAVLTTADVAIHMTCVALHAPVAVLAGMKAPQESLFATRFKRTSSSLVGVAACHRTSFVAKLMSPCFFLLIRFLTDASWPCGSCETCPGTVQPRAVPPPNSPLLPRSAEPP